MVSNHDQLAHATVANAATTVIVARNRRSNRENTGDSLPDWDLAQTSNDREIPSTRRIISHAVRRSHVHILSSPHLDVRCLVSSPLKTTSLRAFANALARVVLSGLTGGAVFSLWLGLFLSLWSWGFEDVAWLLWLLAPLATGFGFGMGVGGGERLFAVGRPTLWTATTWPLAGCIVGAVVVYPFGVMLIVFGMLCMGTVAVAGREWRKAAAGSP